MKNPRKYTALGFLQKGDWSRKDLVTWGGVLGTALVGLVALWTPLMLAPLSEMVGAFMRLHQGQ